ncbi:MAG: hypothetical protein EBS54_09010 [Betaproteobacteria bacterium]|nr:hypothetical protein [Betaproteobacteria bacterium]
MIRLGRQGTNESTTFDVSDPNGRLLVDAALHNTFDFPSGLTKTGSGKLVLASDNIYSGPTTISGGTLQVGNGGTNGTLGTAATGIAISSGAILSFNRTDNYGGNFTRNLSGAGGIILSSGTLTLANSTNSFTGGLTINGGTLKGLGGAIPAANSVVVNSGGTFGMGTTDTWGTAATTNTVAVTVNSGGNMTTDGQFNSLRNLTLNGGTVSLNGGLASTASALVLGGTVTAGGATTSAIAAVSGSNNAIRLGREGTSESTAFNVTDGAGTLAISAPLTNNFGAISGLIKNGDGKLVLSGILGYTGTNTVNGGSLVISNAAYAATITPNAIRLDYSNPPTVGTNNLLPGPVNASSLASYSVNGNGTSP